MLNRSFLTGLALTGALLGTASNAFAQTEPGPAPAYAAPARSGNAPAGAPRYRHRSKVQRALHSLGLSGEQSVRAKAIMRAYRLSRHSANPEPRRVMLAQLRGLLTPAQRSRFEAQLRQGGPNAGPGQQGPGGPNQGPGGGPYQSQSSQGGPYQGQGGPYQGQGQGGPYQGQGGPYQGQGQGQGGPDQNPNQPPSGQPPN